MKFIKIYMKNKLTISHFIPLLGPFYIGAEKLKDEYDITQKYVFSYEAFANNQLHLEQNFNVNIDYLPNDLLPDYGDTQTEWRDISPYKKYINDNKIEPTDILLAVPPCAGLSMLNTGNRGAGCAANKWMYETVKWHLAQDNKVLLLENAPGLVGSEGVKVLREIESILEYNGVRSQYKIHTTKTSTKQHGLPQQRDRTFLYIYKGTEFKRFKNIKRETPLLEYFLESKNRSAEIKENTNHISLNPNWSSEYIKWLNDKNLWDEARNQVPGNYGTKTITDLMFKKLKENPSEFDDYPKLSKEMKRKQAKLDKNLGYWDAAPIVAKGKVNAIIAKNAFNILHPKYNRFLTVREMMDLMGYPDDFELKGDVKRNFNHICQSVPVNTGMDHIRWAEGIVNNNPKYIDGKIDTNADIVLQFNMKQDLQNDIRALYLHDTEFGKLKKNIKNKLASFVE